MKGYEKIEAIINQAHAEAVPITTGPIIALIARSAQAMRTEDCDVFIGSGESTGEAIEAAMAKAGRMHDWVVVVSQVDQDGNHVMPPILCHEPMHSFMKAGMNAVFYVTAGGEWEVYNPS
ncbi:MAG: hypothetical protein K2M42_09305 [Oscillospiraceae bacterium]|nr:hypothetical protein [Oscillospiraceae bacterium]